MRLKIVSFILIELIISILLIPVSAYEISGFVLSSGQGIDNATVNYETNTTQTNASGYYFISNVSGTYNFTYSKNPTHYQNLSSIEITSNLSKNATLDLKPTGTIRGCVFVFGVNLCNLAAAVIQNSNRIRWFF